MCNVWLYQKEIAANSHSRREALSPLHLFPPCRPSMVTLPCFEFLSYTSKKCLQIRFNWWLEGITTESFVLMAWPSKIGIEKIRTTLWKKYLPPQLGCFWGCAQKHPTSNTRTTMPPPAFTDARSWRKDWSWRHLIPPSNYFRWSSNRFQTGTESDKHTGGDLGQHEKQIPNKPHESWDTNSHDRHTTNHNHHSDNSISRHHCSSFRLSL